MTISELNNVIFGLDMILDGFDNDRAIGSDDLQMIREAFREGSRAAIAISRWDVAKSLDWFSRSLSRFGSSEALKEKALEIRNQIVDWQRRPAMPGPGYIWNSFGVCRGFWQTPAERTRSFSVCGI